MPIEAPTRPPESELLDIYQPMLPRETKYPPRTPDWYVEPKMDGMRLIADAKKGTVLPMLRTKTGRDVTLLFPELNPGFR